MNVMKFTTVRNCLITQYLLVVLRSLKERMMEPHRSITITNQTHFRLQLVTNYYFCLFSSNQSIFKRLLQIRLGPLYLYLDLDLDV